MTQQLRFRVCTQKNWKQGLTYLYVHGSIIHNSQKVGATHMSVHR